MALANAGGADEDEVFIPLDEIQIKSIEDELLWNGRRMCPVESVDSFDDGDLGLADASLNDALMSNSGFLGEEVFKEVEMREILGGGLLGLVLEGQGAMVEAKVRGDCGGHFWGSLGFSKRSS